MAHKLAWGIQQSKQDVKDSQKKYLTDSIRLSKVVSVGSDGPSN